MAQTLFLLPGDGIGTEIMAEVEKLIAWTNGQGLTDFTTDTGLVGGCAYDACGAAISEDDMQKALDADAVIFGAVGGPKWDAVPYEVRPEAGLLRLRKDLGLFANLRPAICYPALADASSLKRELVEGLDILIVRELTGGVYFGEPKEITELGNGQKRAVDTQVYESYEIDRICRVAFDLARTRGKKVHSADKKNVMKSGVLWDEVAQGVANPIAMLASFAMALRYSFNMIELAGRLEAAIAGVLEDGLRTGDIAQGGQSIGTEAMGAAVLKKLAA
jgi:3-isopropylmalate dehydrogenase